MRLCFTSHEMIASMEYTEYIFTNSIVLYALIYTKVHLNIYMVCTFYENLARGINQSNKFTNRVWMMGSEGSHIPLWHRDILQFPFNVVIFLLDGWGWPLLGSQDVPASSLFNYLLITRGYLSVCHGLQVYISLWKQHLGTHRSDMSRPGVFLTGMSSGPRRTVAAISGARRLYPGALRSLNLCRQVCTMRHKSISGKENLSLHVNWLIDCQIDCGQKQRFNYCSLY